MWVVHVACVYVIVLDKLKEAENGFRRCCADEAVDILLCVCDQSTTH